MHKSKISLNEVLTNMGFDCEIRHHDKEYFYLLFCNLDTTIRAEMKSNNGNHSICFFCWEKNGELYVPGIAITFEEALASVNEKTRDKMLFNLDIFMDLAGGNYEKYNC
jgi:hypothetical protein